MNQNIHPIQITTIHDSLWIEKNIRLDILRLDLMHPQISGNKWFKLKYNIEEALRQKAQHILSFGGVYSNHLHALAFAGQLFNIKTIGVIRGDKVDNATLNDCKSWGMELHFMPREEYRHKYESDFLKDIQQKFPSSFIVPEGGNNEMGRKGSRQILSNIDLASYTHICSAVGTGATLSGLIDKALPQQLVVGFSAIKNGMYIEDEIKKNSQHRNWTLIHEFHFGGFAKKTEELIRFMENFYASHAIELDRVYTGKMVYGIFEMIRNGQFSENSRILAIHTGGLQGNRSLI